MNPELSDHQKLVLRGQPEHEISEVNDDCYVKCQDACGNFCGCIATWICCLCCTPPYRRISEGTVGIKTRFGRYKGVYPAGLLFVNSCSEDLIIVDKREQVLDLRQQRVITKDNISVIIDAVVYYQIEHAYRAVYNVENLQYAVKEMASTSLRDVFGITTLQEALEDRDKSAEHLYEIIAKPCATWGVRVKRVLLQEILFTPELQRTLSSAATAKRLAESKVIGAQADVQAAKLMRNASDILNTPSAMQIRYLDSITNIGKVGNPKILFFPSDYKQIGSKALMQMGKNKM